MTHVKWPMLWLDYCNRNLAILGLLSLLLPKGKGDGNMLTKEKIAGIFQSIVRIFPGMPSYQEREGLRAQDKVIRLQLASRLEEQDTDIRQIMLELTNRAMLKPLADLDRLSRKLMRLADTIRFASYGYGGLFANIPVDEQKLAELYEYDLTLHQEIEELAVAVSTLKERRDDDWQKDSLEDVQQVLNRLEERIEKRQSVFTQN
ncbi:MAG: hypothetical protein PVG97_03365 [Syntrophobacterales bacterium]|jgi:hypothetical protein